MSQGKHYFDAEQSARLDRAYARRAIAEQRTRTLEALALSPGESALDVGCGPGYLTVEMARAVGERGHVHGIDVSEPMLGFARRRCAPFPWITLQSGDAHRIPLADASVDATASVQVYLFSNNLDRALAELYRVLRAGGRAIVVDTDWDSVVWHSSYRERTEHFLHIWKQRFTNARVARSIPGALRKAGFAIERVTTIPIVELDCDAEGYSSGPLAALPRFVAGKDGISDADVRAWTEDQQALVASGNYFFALGRFLFVARKGG